MKNNWGSRTWFERKSAWKTSLILQKLARVNQQGYESTEEDQNDFTNILS